MKAVLLAGSPKGAHSTSESLGGYLMARLEERGWQTARIRLQAAVKDETRRAGLRAGVAEADLVVLAFPLYVDSLPAPVVQALELLAERLPACPPGGDGRGRRLVAIANCGFPEAAHNDTALGICRCFARHAGLDWAGGLALGAGPAIGGRPLPERGGMVRHVVAALDAAAAALAAGEPLPEQAVAHMARPLIPARLYLWFGGLGWRQWAGKNGARRRLRARPYAA